jgi:hypothetical protein
MSGMTLAIPAGASLKLQQKVAAANAWCVLSGNHTPHMMHA